MVERFNSPKVEKLETSEEVIQETSSNLADLKVKLKDKEKIETLLKNPTLKTGLDKVFKKEAETVISTFWEGYKDSELNGHLSIESWTRLAIKAHPDLAGFICGDLGLPYEEIAVHGMKNTKFSQLTFEQKMGFISFQEALRYYGNDISKVSSDAFIKQCKILTNEHIKRVTEGFQEKLIDNQNLFEGVLGAAKNVKEEDLKNFLLGRFSEIGGEKDDVLVINLERVLKKEYGLTEAECKKVKEYLKVIGEHPEDINVTGMNVTESKMGFGGWLIIGILIGAALSVGGYFTYKYFSSPWELAPTEQISSGGRVEVVNFKEVFEILSARASLDIKDEEGKDSVVNYSEPALKFKNRSRWLVVNGLQRITEETVNFFEGRSIDLKVKKLDVGFVFDASSARCIVEKNKKGKGIFHVKIKKPKVEVLDVKAEVVRSKREKIWNLDKFDDFEMKALESVKAKAIAAANTPDNLKKSKESLRNNMLNVFKITGYSGSGIHIDGKDVEDVILEFED